MTENANIPPDNQLAAPRTRRAGCWLLGAMGVIVVVLLAAPLIISRPIRVSEETTYITGPLKADGQQIDYFAAIVEATRPDHVASDDNGYRLIVRRLGKSAESDPESFARIAEQLGLNARTIQPDLTFEDPFSFATEYLERRADDEGIPGVGTEEDAREAHRAASRLSTSLSWPWTLDDLPMMVRWLDENGAALDLVGEAVRKPLFHVPVARRNEQAVILRDMDHVEWQRLQSISRGLQVRANHRVAIGDLDGASDDIVACQRLARHVARGPWLQDVLFGIAVEGRAHSIGIAGALDHPPGMGHFERLVAEADGLPPVPDLDTAMRFERLVWLDVIQGLAHNAYTWSEHELVSGRRTTGRLATSFLNWNVVLRRYNEHFDAMLASDQEWIEPPEPSSSQMLLIRVRSEALADDLAGPTLPALHAVREATRRGGCARNLKRITLAMLMYERDHGTLPPAYLVDSDGSPLHGWRVLLLPYLGHEELYQRIRLDEPWDSEHNRSLHDEAVDVYRCASHPTAGPGQATYSVVVGPDMPFEGSQGKRLADFGPHSDDMVLVVERFEPIGWMDPTRDVQQSDADEGIGSPHNSYATTPLNTNGIASHHPGGANFGLRNGAVRFVSNAIEIERFRSMLRGTLEERWQ